MNMQHRHDQITTITETITPMRAREYLDKYNRKNRHITESRVKLYAGKMLSGQWRLNGEALIFDSNGDLISGQHRLLACIEANVSFTTCVTRGVSPDVRATIDGGKPRSPGDNIAMLGGKHVFAVSAGSQWVLKYRAGKCTVSLSYPSETVVEFWEKNPEINDSVIHAKDCKNVLQLGIGCGFHFLFAERDYKAANLFMSDLGKGANLGVTDPVYVLREFLQQARVAKIKTPQYEIGARLVRAWGHRRQGATIKIDGLFPEII